MLASLFCIGLILMLHEKMVVVMKGRKILLLFLLVMIVLQTFIISFGIKRFNERGFLPLSECYISDHIRNDSFEIKKYTYLANNDLKKDIIKKFRYRKLKGKKDFVLNKIEEVYDSFEDKDFEKIDFNLIDSDDYYAYKEENGIYTLYYYDNGSDTVYEFIGKEVIINDIDINYNEGIIDDNLLNDDVGVYKEAVVKDKETALAIAKVIFESIDRPKNKDDYFCEDIFYDTEKEIWIITFAKKSKKKGEYIVGGSCSIALRKKDAQIVKIWFEE